MEPPLPSCTLYTRVSDAMFAVTEFAMTERRVRHLAVMAGDHMAGIVSIRDLVKTRLQDAELESPILRGMALGQLAVEQATGAWQGAMRSVAGSLPPRLRSLAMPIMCWVSEHY